jgi:hypothetical protein
LAALAVAGVAVAGCGGSAATTVKTDDPETAFAPLVHLAPDEPFRPTAPRWFLDRSVLWLAPGMGCADQKVAVGRRLKAQRTEVTDYMFITGLGVGPAYWREMYADSGCDRQRERYRYYANELTRPLDSSPDRADGLRLDEGFFLDLEDRSRRGPPFGHAGGKAVVDGVPVFVERRAMDVEGEPGIRLTYWMLYGMNRPDGDAGGSAAGAHEGDWESAQIDLREDGSGEWEPVRLRLADGAGGWRELPWGEVRLESDGTAMHRTHPVLFAERGSHALRPDRDSCPRCARWETWRALREARKQPWYGFGGAWGEVGATARTTGPLGPHGSWPPPTETPPVPD